jgi:hypothetical protein
MESSLICIDKKCYINNKIIGSQETKDAHKNHETIAIDTYLKEIKDGSHPLVKL